MAHLLIVEASQSRRYFMIRALEHEGHAVAAADSTDAALLLMANGHYDMLLANQNLAAGEGAELAKRALEQDPTIHLLLNADESADAGRLPARRSLNTGVQSTSIELGELVSRVESTLAA